MAQLCLRMPSDQGYQARKWSCIAGRISSLAGIVKVEKIAGFFHWNFYTKNIPDVTFSKKNVYIK